MPDVDLGDVTIHYEEAGTDKPNALVFCHTLGGSGERFLEQFPFWSQHFRVVAWDNRGLGQSSAAAKYNVPAYASDLARLMDHLGIARALLYGAAWGGILIQQFALDYPEKCAAIILDSTSSELNTAASESWYQRGENARLGKTENVYAQATPEHLDSFVAQQRAIAGLREHPFTPRLKNITCPALVLAGRESDRAGGAVIIARSIPNAKLILQDASGG